MFIRLISLLSFLILAVLANAQTPDQLAATLLWSDTFTVGRAHSGSGLRASGLTRSNWRACSGKGIKSFRVRTGADRADSPLLWLAAGDLGWAVDLPGSGSRRLVGPPWACEVLDILEENGRLWLAWAGGIAMRQGEKGTWQNKAMGFTSVLCRWQDRVWAGTEKGLTRWQEDKDCFRPMALADKGLRTLLPHQGYLYIGTFRHGVYRLSPDGKMEFMGLAGCTVEGLAGHGDRLFAAAGDRGIQVRGLGEEKFGSKAMGAWLPLKRWPVDASSLVLVPGGKGEKLTIFAGTMGNGVQVSRDGGDTWNSFGLAGGHVSSLALFKSRSLPPRSEYTAMPTDDPITVMRKWHLGRCRENPRRINFYNLRWALTDDQLRPYAQQRARELLAAPAGDMFFQYPMVGAWYHCHKLLPADLRARFRHTMLTYAGFRGDTENHLCMWHTALYLTAAAFPDAGPKCWYTGRSSAENMAFARNYLYRWMEQVARQGQMEYDSPHYCNCFFGPLFLLHDFAPEEKMRKAAKAMINLLLADYAADHFQGIYGGAHSREPRYSPFRMDWDSAGSLAFLFWGARGYGEPRFCTHSTWAGLSSYKCPDVIKRIATNRNAAVNRFERKRVRNRWRFHPGDPNPPVFKTHYLTSLFTVGCTQGGILQPVQQHTWDASWRDKSGKARTLFTLHPFMNIVEWAMFFPEDPIRMRAVALAQKGTYFKDDKWIGASPHERVIQHKDCVFALYRVPPGEKTDHIDGYLPAPPEAVKRAKGWLAINSDPIFAALWCSEKCTLTPAPENGTRARVGTGTRAFVATINPASRWKSFAHFIAALEKNEPQFDQGKCLVEWQSLAGRQLRGSWTGGGEVGGKKTILPKQMLFLGPWINSQLGSGVIKITEGPDCLTLDFPSLLH